MSSLSFDPGTGSAYWAGAWQPGSDRTLAVYDPATEQVLATVPSHGGAAARDAIASAEQAVGVLSLDARRDLLVRIAQALERDEDVLARTITLENGKPLSQSRAEVRYAAGFYADAANRLHLLAPHRLDERPRDLTWTVHRRPAGVVGLVTPWNFPLAMLAKKLSAAIGAGCASVVKPASATPLTCIRFFQLLHELDAPPGLFNLVIGSASEIGGVLCSHPAVRIVSFTGSTEVGARLVEQTAPHIKRTAMELGGNAPFLVFDDVDLDETVQALAANKLRASGQTCVCTNRVFVQDALHDAFVDALVAHVRTLSVGPGLEDPDVGPLIDADAAQRVRSLLEDAAQAGASLVTGGEVDGTFMTPAVVTGLTSDMALAQTEVFGPVFAVGRFHSEEDAVRLGNDTEYGLAAYVFSHDVERGLRVASRLRFGHVAVNSGSGPTPEAPFGGMKHSGFGREGGDEGLLEFTEIQTIARG